MSSGRCFVWWLRSIGFDWASEGPVRAEGFLTDGTMGVYHRATAKQGDSAAIFDLELRAAVG